MLQRPSQTSPAASKSMSSSNLTFEQRFIGVSSFRIYWKDFLSVNLCSNSVHVSQLWSSSEEAHTWSHMSVWFLHVYHSNARKASKSTVINPQRKIFQTFLEFFSDVTLSHCVCRNAVVQLPACEQLPSRFNFKYEVMTVTISNMNIPKSLWEHLVCLIW